METYKDIKTDVECCARSRAETIREITKWLRSDEAQKMSEDRGIGSADSAEYADEIERRFGAGMEGK